MAATAATVAVVQKPTAPGNLFLAINDITFGDTYLAYTVSPADFGLNVIDFVVGVCMAPQNAVKDADAQYDSTNNEVRLIVSSTGLELGAIDATTYVARLVVLGH